MPNIDKKYYHNLDLDSNEIKAGRIYNLTTTQRNALSLTTSDKGYIVFDTTLLALFIWNGTAWISAGGGSQNLQQVVNTGNGISNFGGSGTASIQSTNFTNDRTLYLNSDTTPTISIVDNLNGSHYTTIDIDTLDLNGTSYNWSDIVAANILTALPFTTDHLAATNNPYLINDVVWYSGNVYRCIANNDSILPTNTSYWTNLGAGYPLIQQPVDWNSTSGNNQILNKPTISVSVGFEQNFLLMGA
jgi:hypothetical protein